jgi:cytochrome bd-type quinol oxidase subunit 2
MEFGFKVRTMKKASLMGRLITVLMIMALAFALPSFVFADEPASPATDNPPANEQAVQQGYAPDQVIIMEDPVPLSNKPWEYGWSLFNLIATILTVAIAVILAIAMVASRRKDKKPNNRFGLSIFAFIAAFLSVLLFAGTQPITVPNAQMLIFDSYSVAHVSVLAVAILCGALSVRKEDFARILPEK